jgi:hypothetical protein
MAATVAEGGTARPVFTVEDAIGMLDAKCSLEAFQERMLSSEFNVARDGEGVYWTAWRPEHKPIRAWLRSLDFAARVGAIEWRDPLQVFFNACREGDEEYVSRMSEEHPEWLDKGSEHGGSTVLHAVCLGGLMQFVPELVTRFGDVDLKDSLGRTPLFWACWGGHLAVFEYLLSVGADAEVVSRGDRTMLHAACDGGNLVMVRALLDMGLDVNTGREGVDSVLHIACHVGNLALIQSLFERGASIESLDVEGYTPLTRALCLGHGEAAEYLVSVGGQLENAREYERWVVNGVLSKDSVAGMMLLLSREVVSVSEELIDRCLRDGREEHAVLRYVLLLEQSVPFLSGVDVSLLPDGFLGGCASVSKWREHELRMDLRYLMLSWRRGFVVSRLEG